MSRRERCFSWSAKQSKRVFGRFSTSRDDRFFRLAEQRKCLQLTAGTKENEFFWTTFRVVELCVNVGEFGVTKEPSDDSRTFLQSFQGVNRDCLQLVSGQRHSPSDPVVFDIFVDPFVRVQLGRVGWKEEQF